MNEQRRHDEELPVALRELGEHLRAAAHREYGRPVTSWHRVPRRGLALAAALVVLGVGGATAAGLISVGKPAGDRRDLPATLRPNSSPRTIAVKVGVTEDVVRARVSRGLRSLATDLKPAELRDAG